MSANSVRAVLAMQGMVQMDVGRFVARVVSGGSVAVGGLRCEWFVKSYEGGCCEFLVC